MSNHSLHIVNSTAANRTAANRTAGSTPMTTPLSSRPLRRMAATLVLFSGVALPSLASASEEFPTELRAAANLECTPTCIVCHEQNPGSAGTATKPFAVAMKNPELLGDDKLVGTKPETVATAYDRLDADGDRVAEWPVGDAGETESLDLATVPCEAQVDYGCSIESKPQRGGLAGWWTPFVLAALGLGAFARRRLVS